jgi:hypothetical protein
MRNSRKASKPTSGIKGKSRWDNLRTLQKI